MRTYMARQQLVMLALTLMVMLHGPLLFAEVSSQSESTMSWPMQAGESINDLARLFYPQDKYMQQQFAAAAIKLNLADRPDLSPATVFDQESTIIIPSIKVLSKKGKSKFTQPTSGNDSVVTPPVSLTMSTKLQAEYDNLIKRNAIFKENLDTINAKLTHLQQVFVALKTELIQLIESAKPVVPVEPVAVVHEQKSVRQPQKMMGIITPAHAEKSNANGSKNSGMHPAIIKALTALLPGNKRFISNY